MLKLEEFEARFMRNGKYLIKRFDFITGIVLLLTPWTELEFAVRYWFVRSTIKENSMWTFFAQRPDDMVWIEISRFTFNKLLISGKRNVKQEWLTLIKGE